MSKKGLDITTMPAELQEQLLYAVGALDPRPPVVKAQQPSTAAVAAPAPAMPSNGYLRRAGEAIARADDAVQTAIRQKLYGERPDGSYPEGNIAGAKAIIAQLLHSSGDLVTDDAVGLRYLLGSRALQAGAVGGTGYGLASLLGDTEEPGQLPM